jgi:hypothetical protein
LLKKLQARELELVEELKQNREAQRLLRAYTSRDGVASFHAKVELKAAIENATPDAETQVFADMVKRGVKLPALIQFVLARLQQATSQKDILEFLKDAKWKGSDELLRTSLYRMTDKQRVLFREVDDGGTTVYGLAEWKK